jgi:phosphotransferase system HPr-like phosphotransfer protein
MQSVKIKLETIEKVKSFINVINRLDGDFDLSHSRYVVDAKSIMGVISLDLSKELTLNSVNGTVDETIFKDFLA